MSSETYDNAYLLSENYATGAFTTTEQISGMPTISDPSGSELTFGTPIEFQDSYNTITLLYDGPVTENGAQVGFAAVDPNTGAIYLFTNETIPAGTSLVIDTGVPTSICFMAGTAVATPSGEQAIETLAIGSLVTTSDGAVKPIKWIGRQSIATTFADPLSTSPIRIRAGALGDSLPVRDLLVSPHHALLVDGVLIQASALVNDISIVRETALAERFTYYHVELADHALILAEGVPAETFVDNVGRARFDNYAEHRELYGEPTQVQEMRHLRAQSSRQVPYATRARLLAIAEQTYGVLQAA